MEPIALYSCNIDLDYVGYRVVVKAGNSVEHYSETVFRILVRFHFCGICHGSFNRTPSLITSFWVPLLANGEYHRANVHLFKIKCVIMVKTTNMKFTSRTQHAIQYKFNERKNMRCHVYEKPNVKQEWRGMEERREEKKMMNVVCLKIMKEITCVIFDRHTFVLIK